MSAVVIAKSREPETGSSLHAGGLFRSYSWVSPLSAQVRAAIVQVQWWTRMRPRSAMSILPDQVNHLYSNPTSQLHCQLECRRTVS